MAAVSSEAATSTAAAAAISPEAISSDAIAPDAHVPSPALTSPGSPRSPAYTASLEGELRELRARSRSLQGEKARLMAENAKLQVESESACARHDAASLAERELREEVKGLRVENARLRVRLEVAEERLAQQSAQSAAEGEAAKDALRRQASGEHAKTVAALTKQAKEMDALQAALEAKHSELNAAVAEAGSLRSQVRVLQKRALDLEAAANGVSSTKASDKAHEFVKKLQGGATSTAAGSPRTRPGSATAAAAVVKSPR